jgi:hypothetical protein
LSWRTGLRELLLSAEIEFYPSYALFKEHASLQADARVWCGAGRDRTDDIQLAKLALSQLSYSPGTWYGER